MSRVAVFLTCMVLLMFNALHAGDCIQWNQVKEDISKNFFGKNPAYLMVSIEKEGESSTGVFGMGTGKFTKDKSGKSVEVIETVMLCVQNAKVTYTVKNDKTGRKITISVTVFYRDKGGAFVYDGISAGDGK